jgi:hypothetical protein
LTEGRRRTLRLQLERRFGSLEAIHELAIEAASDFDLNICFDRLETAHSASRVVEHMLPPEVGRD